MTKITEEMLVGAVSALAVEAGLTFEIEDASIDGEKKERIILHQRINTGLQEGGHGRHHLNWPEFYTTATLYDAVRLARDVVAVYKQKPKPPKPLVYLDGGETCLQTYLEDRTIEEWISIGKSLHQSWMYVGWRHEPFPDDKRIGLGEKEKVIVFDKKQWSDEEIALRRSNDFHIEETRGLW